MDPEMNPHYRLHVLAIVDLAKVERLGAGKEVLPPADWLCRCRHLGRRRVVTDMTFDGALLVLLGSIEASMEWYLAAMSLANDRVGHGAVDSINKCLCVGLGVLVGIGFDVTLSGKEHGVAKQRSRRTQCHAT